MSLKKFAVVLLALFSTTALMVTGCSSGDGQKPGTGGGPGGEPIKVGFMICNSRAETEARFKPLTAWLSIKLGRKVVPVTIDTQDFEQAVSDGGLDFTHTNSLLYVILNKHYGVEPLTGDVQGRYGHKTNGGILVRADSPIKSISDLKGKRMVFGPMFAPTGYLSQYDLMLKNGFDPETYLGVYKIPGGSHKHEKVIFALMDGAFDGEAVDGAFVPMLDFEQMAAEGKIDPADFRIIAETEPIPYCTFGATEKADDALVKRFKEAVLSLKPEDTVEIDGERVKVLKAARLDGFAPVDDAEYDIVREMAKNCNMPPYQKY